MAQNKKWALPPIEKIYEAFSAIADGRIKMIDGFAQISSSDYKKEYTVKWNEDVYSSNDNASYWQGYMGYPLIAVLMLQGKVTYDHNITGYFRDINWKQLNAKYKNNYAIAASVILDGLTAAGIDTEYIKAEVNKIYEQLKCLDIKRERGSAPPKAES